MDKDIFIKLLAQREFKAVRSILDVMNAYGNACACFSEVN